MDNEFENIFVKLMMRIIARGFQLEDSSINSINEIETFIYAPHGILRRKT